LRLIALGVSILWCTETDAQFASRFSLSVGEEYNDNIFFTEQREHDFITNITPTLTFLYQPPVESASPFVLNISPVGQIFARHPEENNFGDGVNVNAGYIYRYSPRLTFDIRETFQTTGRTQTGLAAGNAFNRPTFTPVRPGAPGLPISSVNIANFVPNGRTLDNQFSLSGSYLLRPNITLGGGYTSSIINYLDLGGTDVSHSVGVRGSYRWRQEHNLYAAYSVQFLNSRDNDNSVIHNINIGDDYFSNTLIQLTPTLILTFSTGVSLNTSNDGPRVTNNTILQLIKLWEKASFRVGVFKGLTSSQGVSGVSDTIDLVSSFNILFTERLSANAGVDYSFFDTDDVNFRPFRGYTGLRYGITNWLCSDLRYTHRRLFAGSGGQNTVLQNRGNVYGNSVSLLLSIDFDLWPNLGLARSRGCAATPVGASQFPQRYDSG
jgi:hypothetical protein